MEKSVWVSISKCPNWKQLKKPGSTLKSVNKLKMLALKTEFTKRFDNKIIKNSHQKTIFQQNGNKRARYTYSKVYRFFALQSSSVPEVKLMGVELIGVNKLGLINWSQLIGVN